MHDRSLLLYSYSFLVSGASSTNPDQTGRETIFMRSQLATKSKSPNNFEITFHTKPYNYVVKHLPTLPIVQL